MLNKIILYCSLLVICVNSYIINPGPLYPATKGEIWPLVYKQIKSEDFYVLRPNSFEFNVVNYDCSILKQAITRYWLIINQENKWNFKMPKSDVYKKLNNTSFKGFLDSINVNLTLNCNGDELPYFGMDESYEIVISQKRSEIKSSSIWGILRGLESFSQLIYMNQDTEMLNINQTKIYDQPRYSHRGLLLDTSRHFISVKKILETLDAMAYNKMNVFHWHIVDDQSFPYVSLKFPKMSQKGAYHPVSRVYQQEDIKNIIEYARVRGIRVMAEFDTPGHTRSWEAIQGLLTPCYDKKTQKPSGQYGPINPIRKDTYDFLKEFFGEVVQVFPDKYVHLGGDEVGFECWQSNPDVNRFMEASNLTGDYAGLESFYIQRLVKIVQNLKTNFIVWQEVFTNGVKLPEETIVHVWIDSNYKKLMSNITAEGKKTILSACYYLDHLETGGDWLPYYKCDPGNFSATPEQKKLVMGGEAAMWSEVVNDYNVISRVWPRASAVAEKLWSMESPNLNIDDEDNNIINLTIKGKLTRDTYLVARRLEEHTCRMNKRDIGAQPPSGPGVCL